MKEQIENEIQDLTSYIEELKLQIYGYEKRVISLQTDLLAQKALEITEVEGVVVENCKQPSPRDILEQEWCDLLEENKRDIWNFIRLKKLTHNITQLEEKTSFSPEDIKVLLSTHDSLIPEKASCLLGIPFNVCEKWPLLASGSAAILPEGEDL